jgi:hypothetical protein
MLLSHTSGFKNMMDETLLYDSLVFIWLASPAMCSTAYLPFMHCKCYGHRVGPAHLTWESAWNALPAVCTPALHLGHAHEPDAERRVAGAVYVRGCDTLQVLVAFDRPVLFQLDPDTLGRVKTNGSCARA